MSWRGSLLALALLACGAPPPAPAPKSLDVQCVEGLQSVCPWIWAARPAQVYLGAWSQNGDQLALPGAWQAGADVYAWICVVHTTGQRSYGCNPRPLDLDLQPYPIAFGPAPGQP